MKKNTTFIFMFLFILMMSSCIVPETSLNMNDTRAESLTVDKEGASAQSDMWSVELIGAETSESLLTTIAAIQYGGDILTTQNLIKPAKGNVFLLLELTIEKIGTGKASFSWGDAHVKDQDENIYYRHPNDTFLANLNIPRIRGTDIVLGREYGFVCFEIPKTADGLVFVADEGKIKITVRP